MAIFFDKEQLKNVVEVHPVKSRIIGIPDTVLRHNPVQWTPEKVESVIVRRNAGETTESIAESLGVTKQTVTARIREYNKKKNAPKKAQDKPKWTDKMILDVMRRMKKGESTKSIASSLSLSTNTINDKVREYKRLNAHLFF